SIPSLPILRDSTISNRVFTDKSFLGKPHSSFEDDADVFPDNETFEHLGDAILGYCVTKLIRSVYPKLNPGGATIVRSRIVENRNLAAIAKAYHMDERLTVSTAQPSIKNHDRALARAIEAFVGGLHEEQGLAAVETWIRALFLPFVRTEYEILRE
ncbi:ribonuclease III domain-containing protein, partial [Cantharellus anzutake]|uniref:ribonuclease III domain-containing protein n=1 Tax=Cantharellus anzutake TaxID=1750568 RepID=UPI0019061088